MNTRFNMRQWLIILFLLKFSITYADSTLELLHVDWIDKHIDPIKNFYAYANTNWQKNNPIPANYARWDTFSILQRQTEYNLNKIMQSLANNKNYSQNSIEQKIGDFYHSGMDITIINKLKLQPLELILTKITKINNINDLENLLPELQLIGVPAIFNFSSMQDFHNSQQIIGVAIQGGLGLPDRDYYCSDHSRFKKILNIYEQHIVKILILSGINQQSAIKQAKSILNIETQLAQASLTQIQQRDPNQIYNIKSIAELQQITPHFIWSKYLSALNLSNIKSINLAMPKFFQDLDNMFNKIAIDDWKIYLHWQVLNTFAAYLPQEFLIEDFKMNKTLSGAQQLLPRWQRVVNTVNNSLAFAVGKIYVQKYFSTNDQIIVTNMIHNIDNAFKQVLINANWMTNATKKAALIKLNMMDKRVGFPKNWRDYSALNINRYTYIQNIMNANKFNNYYELAKIGKPVDRNEWIMPPQTVNAYYDPSVNNINILAGILQSPFFNSKAPDAINYGAIGFVIGHELTHGFDDQGSKFDANGNLHNWWTTADRNKFDKNINCLIKQFSAYTYINNNIHVQGKLVVGEAAADLGGLILAYKAFQATQNYKNAPIIAGFTPDQQFFISAAHTWAGNIRPELAHHLITVDPHPPMIYRVNGTLTNITAFKQAFSQNINQEPQCKIW